MTTGEVMKARLADSAFAVSSGFVTGSKTCRASRRYSLPRGSPVVTRDDAASHWSRTRVAGSVGEGERAFEMFRGENRIAVQHESFADRFFLGQLLFGKTERFGTVARATVSGDGFVKCKNTRGFGGGLFRVLQTLFMIAGLNVVMGQLFNCTLRLIA